MKNLDVADSATSDAEEEEEDVQQVDESWALALLEEALEGKLDEELKEELAEARGHTRGDGSQELNSNQGVSLSAIEMQQQAFPQIKKFNTRSEVMANKRSRRWLAYLIDKFTEVVYREYRVPVRDPSRKGFSLKWQLRFELLVLAEKGLNSALAVLGSASW